MSKNMGRTAALTRDSRSAHCTSDDDRDGMMGGESAKRSARADKQNIGAGSRPALLQIGHYRMSNLLGQRQPSLVTSFSRYVDFCSFPIDITQTKRNDITCPKSQARK